MQRFAIVKLVKSRSCPLYRVQTRITDVAMLQRVARIPSLVDCISKSWMRVLFKSLKVKRTWTRPWIPKGFARRLSNAIQNAASNKGFFRFGEGGCVAFRWPRLTSAVASGSLSSSLDPMRRVMKTLLHCGTFWLANWLLWVHWNVASTNCVCVRVRVTRTAACVPNEFKCQIFNHRNEYSFRVLRLW